LFPAHALYLALDPHLPLERLPEKAQRRPRVHRQLVPLAAVVVGVEREATLVRRLEEHDPRGGRDSGVGRGERHRIRFGDSCRHCFGEPPRELLNWITRNVRLVQSPPPVIHARRRRHDSGLRRRPNYFACATGHDRNSECSRVSSSRSPYYGFQRAASMIDHRWMIHPRKTSHSTPASTKWTSALRTRPCTSCPSP